MQQTIYKRNANMQSRIYETLASKMLIKVQLKADQDFMLFTADERPCQSEAPEKDKACFQI
jgi:hypothetical protein